ncbi:MAG: creatininase [Peptococcaceae bacterium BICA1-8]|nr:MAG: creatininase [Peptococcaceae bacterium BICA1-8]
MKKSNRMLELTQPEVEKELNEHGLVIIPTGSVEQHGPHLPLGTDYYAIEAIAERVAAKMGGLLVPFPHVGVTPFHMSFAGSITFSQETFMQVFKDICDSLIKHNANKIVVVNWHEGNTGAINTICARLQVEYPNVIFIISQACYIAEKLYSDVGLNHGGALEVLPVQGYRPELVHLERATNPSPKDRAKKMDALRRRREAYPIIPDIRIMYPTGWYGDLEICTPENAEIFLEKVSDHVVASVQETLKEMEMI